MTDSWDLGSGLLFGNDSNIKEPSKPPGNPPWQVGGILMIIYGFETRRRLEKRQRNGSRERLSLLNL